MLVKAILGLLALSLKVVSSQDDDFPTDTDDAAIVSSVMYAPLPTPLTRQLMVETPEFTSNNEQKTPCYNYRTDFSRNTRGWQVENSMQDTYDLDSNGIKLNLVPPKEYKRLRDPVSKYIYKHFHTIIVLILPSKFALQSIRRKRPNIKLNHLYEIR